MSYWQPSADVYRHAGGWIVKLDLAGVQPDDVQVRLDGRRLSIYGVRRDRTVQLGCVPYSLEISYSRFERSLELPDIPKSVRVFTEQDSGMLLIRIATEEADHG
jgi:HSP20 family protein